MRSCLSSAIILFCVIFASAQISSGRMIKEGDRYFEQKLFRSALKYYKQGGDIQTWNKETKLHVGICQFEINQINESISILKNLERIGKTDPLVPYYLAKSYQNRNQFSEAILYYKQFLRKRKTEESTRDLVKDEILRCANGLQLKYGDEIAYVENLGSALNTLEDEIAPLPSATYQDRIYFSSNRAGSIGGKTNARGESDNFFGQYNSDMYTLDQIEGTWEKIQPLGGNLNTSKNEILYDISPDGQILYYLQGNQILTDTFDNDASKSSRKGLFGNPISTSTGDRDLQVFSDSIILFSSNGRGGYGGYDLFISVKRYGRWIDPVNLGSNINSFYNETNPFLAADGRTLYFSSNNLQSVGGLDIFSAYFQDRQRKWSVPKNIGIPINSAGDDFGFSLRNDGLSGFFNSNRKESYGGQDIYLAYFKEQIKEHLILSNPITFYQVLDSKEVEIAGQPMSTIDQELMENKEYFIGDLFYSVSDVILTPQNIKKLDLISNMMQIYPKITLEAICHDISEGPDAFTLYFSVKKAEKVREYLIRKGVEGSRISVKGGGSKYPMAKDVQGQSGSPMVAKLNKRIDLRFHNYEEEPIKIIREEIQIPSNIEDTKGKLFNIVTKGLYYQIELLTATQMYQNEIIENEPHVLIEFDPIKNRYIYLVGLAQKYDQAKAQLSNFRSLGFDNAKIFAFLGGKRLERNQLLEHADKYPDLLNFFE